MLTGSFIFPSRFMEDDLNDLNYPSCFTLAVHFVYTKHSDGQKKTIEDQQ